jgi:hypothetical protein
MEFYLSVSELLGKTANPLILIFVPIFLFTTLAEALLILHRQGTYPWKNAGVSISMAVGHDPLWPVASALGPQQPSFHRL